jgi:hypothetical protein
MDQIQLGKDIANDCDERDIHLKLRYHYIEYTTGKKIISLKVLARLYIKMYSTYTYLPLPPTPFKMRDVKDDC